MDEKSREALLGRMKETTGLPNPNLPIQILNWLEEHSLQADLLGKTQVAEILKTQVFRWKRFARRWDVLLRGSKDWS